VDSFKAELEVKEAEITKLRQEAVAAEGAGKVEIARPKAVAASEAAAAQAAAVAAAAEIATLKAEKAIRDRSSGRRSTSLPPVRQRALEEKIAQVRYYTVRLGNSKLPLLPRSLLLSISINRKTENTTQ
jgi:hydroxypyruvate isomerase